MIARFCARQSLVWMVLLIGLMPLMGCVLTSGGPSSTTVGDETQTLDQEGVVSPLVEEAPIPTMAGTTTFLMPNDNSEPLATYTVSVTQAPIDQVLFALARDAKLNIDIYPGIQSLVTINAVNETLPAILDRVAEQANLQYQINNSSIIITPDTPFRRNYQLDYIPVKRSMKSDMSVSTSADSSGSGGGGNNSKVSLSTESEIDFWKDLVANITSMATPPVVQETPSNSDAAPTASGVSAGGALPGVEAPVSTSTQATTQAPAVSPLVWNRATGLINVLATSRQHKQIQVFLDQVMRTATRQVYIEATVVSVELSDQFQAGVDWSLMSSGTNDSQSMLSNRISSPPNLTLRLNQTNIPFLSGVLGVKDLTSTVSMLSQFGNIKVISTPKITVLNNQTAILRVTTNEVYFEITVTPGETTSENGVSTTTRAILTTSTRTAPIGFIMQVTPQIDDNQVVTMNLRPTIQRISKWVDNPDPNMRQNLSSEQEFTPPQIPVIQVQEMDSILRVVSGEVAVMGGLMEDSFEKDMDGVPFLSEVPIIGSLFSYRKNDKIKKELIIFLRPIVINDSNDMYKITNQDMYASRNQPFSGYSDQMKLNVR